MRHDHRPYAAKRLHRAIERAYVDHFVSPQLDALGPHHQIMKPWHLNLSGANIRIGRSVHIINAADRNVNLTTWQFAEHAGHIDIGDFCLLSPGVRIDSATCVEIGSNSMLAASVYITDADWHDLYDRTRPIGTTRPVILENNVWIGDSCIVCKGVRIGADTVVGAGSVVTSDLPAGVIAAGNPARVIRPLDASIPLRRRQDLLEDQLALDHQVDQLERYLHGSRTWWGWMKSVLRPTRDD
ncbi:MAG: acyltransferase [Pseudomonadales bacterium]|nr:acyltransferase [Pseudomonadales bacterium]